MVPGDVNDVLHRKRARRILGIWENIFTSFVMPFDVFHVTDTNTKPILFSMSDRTAKQFYLISKEVFPLVIG